MSDSTTHPYSSNGHVVPSQLKAEDDSTEDHMEEPQSKLGSKAAHHYKKAAPISTIYNTSTDTTPQPLIDTSEGDWIDVLGNGLLTKKVVRQGEGVSTRPSPQSEVTLRVLGYCNGRLVDRMDSIKFYLSDNDVIQAVDIATSLMERGEICHIQTNYKYAYGPTGRLPEIPPNSSLLYELELLRVAPPIDILTITEGDLISILNNKRGRGNDLFQRKEYTQAVVSYGRAVKLIRDYRQKRDEGSAEINDLWIRFLNNLAAAQLKVDQLDEALSSAHEVLKIDPDNVKALYRCGKVLLIKEEFDESVRLLQRACELSPEEKAIHSELRKAMQKQSQSKKSEKELYKRMISPSHPVHPPRSSLPPRPSTTTTTSTSGSHSWVIGWKGLVFGAGMIAVLAVGAAALYTKYRK